MLALVAGLQANELANSLVRKPVTDYEQLIAKAHGYMDIEEARAYKVASGYGEVAAAIAPVPAATPIPPVPAPAPLAVVAIPVVALVPEPVRDPSPRPKPSRDPPRVDHRSNRSDRRDRRREPAPRIARTVLNTSLTDALYMVRKEGYLNESPPLMRSNPHNRDTWQYCRYHKDHSHVTNDCRVLRRDIEDLIQRGYLQKLVSQKDRRENVPRGADRGRSRLPRPQQQRDERPPEASHKGVITIISGGPTAGGSSNNDRKKYAKQALQVNSVDKRPRIDEPISFLRRCESERSGDASRQPHRHLGRHRRLPSKENHGRHRKLGRRPVH